MAMEFARPNAFFTYAVVLTALFTLFAAWRLTRRTAERAAETREHFLTYPQTSPEIYAWLPYHQEEAGEASHARPIASRLPSPGSPDRQAGLAAPDPPC
jgi:hypothetical protein